MGKQKRIVSWLPNSQLTGAIIFLLALFLWMEVRDRE